MKAWSVGLGVGLLGAVVMGIRHGLKARESQGLPENVAPPEFSPRIFYSSFGEIFYRVAGEGAPLIFVHSVGVGAASFEWRLVYERFARSHRVMAIDLIGFGESRRPAVALDADDYARTLAEFIRGICESTRPVVVASGLSAGFSLKMAAHHPEIAERIIALVPESADWLGNVKQPWGIRLAGKLPGLNRFLYQNYLASRGSIRRWLEEAGFADRSQVTQELVETYFGFARQAGAEHAIFQYIRGKLGVNLEQLMPDLTLPVHLIWSRNRKMASIKAGEELCEQTTHATLDILENSGLLAALEVPDEVSALLERLLNGPALRVVE